MLYCFYYACWVFLTLFSLISLFLVFLEKKEREECRVSPASSFLLSLDAKVNILPGACTLSAEDVVVTLQLDNLQVIFLLGNLPWGQLTHLG